MITPPWPDVYVYQAVYRLAPRRVVDSTREREADFVAVYRGAVGAGAVAVPHGALTRRR